MFQQLTTKQSRNLAITLFVLMVLFLCWFFIAPQWADARMYTSKAEDLQFKLAKYQQAIRNEPQLKKEQLDTTQQLNSAQLFYTGMASGVAAAKVQTTIRKTVEKANGNVISTQILMEKKGEDFIKITISLRLSGSDRVLQTLLYELETLRPLLTVEKVVISSKRRPNKQNIMTTPLNIILEISSYLAREEIE